MNQTNSFKSFLFKTDYTINLMAIIANSFVMVFTVFILLSSEPPKSNDMPFSGIMGQLLFALLTQFILGFIQVISNLLHIVYFRHNKQFKPWRLGILLATFLYLMMFYLPVFSAFSDNFGVILIFFIIPQVYAYAYFYVLYRDFYSMVK